MFLDEPYPRSIDGKYLIDRYAMPAALNAIVERIVDLDAMAKQKRVEADRWEREDANSRILKARRRFIALCEEFRELDVQALWTFCGAKPPPGVTYRDLRIVG